MNAHFSYANSSLPILTLSLSLSTLVRHFFLFLLFSRPDEELLLSPRASRTDRTLLHFVCVQSPAPSFRPAINYICPDSPRLFRIARLIKNFQNALLFAPSQALVGQKYKPIVAPLWLDNAQFDELRRLVTECGLTDLNLLDQLYQEDRNCLPHARRRLKAPATLGQLARKLQQSPNDARLRKFACDLEQLLGQLEYAARLAAREQPTQELRVQSAIHRLLNAAFTLPDHANRVLACVRRFEGNQFNFNLGRSP
jgi:hypothetical protein